MTQAPFETQHPQAGQAPIDPQGPTVDPIDTVDPVAQYEDFWGSTETFKFMLPDGKQFFEIAPMNEGAKSKFQKMTNKGIRVNQKSQDATLDVDPAGERHTLIKESLVGWNIMQRDPNTPGGWAPYDFPGGAHDDSRKRRAIEGLLEKFNPKVIQDLEFFIRTKNPWMQADMDLEAIDEELDRLNTLRRQKLEEMQGEGSSATK